MMFLLLVLVAQAAAGSWLPEQTSRVLPEDVLYLEQATGRRILLQLDPPDTRVEVEYEGLDLGLAAGPAGTLLVPEYGTRRVIELRVLTEAKVRLWRESASFEPAIWDRYERELAAWAKEGGELPEAPAELGVLHHSWAARRAALEEADELDSGFLIATMLFELEVARARGITDHAREVGEPLWVAPGGESAVAVEGPGVLLLDARMELEVGEFGALEIGLERDGHWLGEWTRRASEDPENPGLSWARRSAIFIPPGVHAVRITAGQERGFWINPSIERPRPSWRYVRALDALHETEWPEGSVRRMEAAWVLGENEEAREAAFDLHERPGEALARVRLARLVEDPQHALRFWLEDLTDPLLLHAIAERAVLVRDIDPDLVVPFAELLPDDPELLAGLADRVARGFVRPRGEAIRWLAHLDARGSAASRWTSLPLLEGESEARLVSQSPGIARVRVSAGQEAQLLLPLHPRGIPVARLQADHAVTYRLDHVGLHGAGELFEGFEPDVPHLVEVLEGELLLLDPDHVVEGGERVYEQQIASLPAVWSLIEPGAPAQIAVTVYGGPGELLAWTDDGMTWTMSVSAPEVEGEPSAHFVLPMGPWSRIVGVDSDDDVEVSLALRRTVPRADRALPEPVGDPLEELEQASRFLVELLNADGTGQAIADQRLRRAGAFVALGFRGTARGEANLVLYLPGTTERQRQEARAPIAPGGFVAVVGPATADAALAREGRLPPLEPVEPEDWLDLVSLVRPDLQPFLYREASRLFLEQGRVLEAWKAADSAGPAGADEGRRAEYAGSWSVLSSLDRDAGVVNVRIQREPPTLLEDGLFAVTREASLGMPWPGAEVAVVRGGREDRLEFTGGGELVLEMLCRDETTRLDPKPCRVEIELNGVPEVVEIPDGRFGSWSAMLPADAHELILRPLWEDHSAVGVRAELDGELLPPVVTVSTHKVGRRGAGVTVLGPTLLRVRVHDGGPVTVSADGDSMEVVDSGVMAIEAEGPVSVMVTGPPGALITVARHDLDGPRHDPVERLATRALAPDAPEPYGPSAWATWIWMNRVAHPLERTPRPMGDGGTLVLGAEVGDDVSIFPTDLRHWWYAQADAAWLYRVGTTRHWVDAQVLGRESLQLVPSVGARAGWTWMPPMLAASADLRTWRSFGAGHVALSTELRYRRWVGLWWRFEPFVQGHAGVWSPAPMGKVDPRAWTQFNVDHPWGIGLGAHADWRRHKDLRVRNTLRGYSNAGPSVDRLSGRIGADLQIADPIYTGVGATMEYRFQDLHRDFGFWRPSMDAYLTVPMWRSPTRRLVLDGRARYYPMQNLADVRVRVTLETSRRRGLRDHPPIDEVYYMARELPEGMR